MTTLQSLQKAKEGIASEKRKTVAPTLLARAYAQRAGDREPLHLRMRLAILDALAQGAWSAGDKLPAERDIASEVGLSLGTVQKTLSALAVDGVLVRRHGHGTFVAGDMTQSSQLLHFRFVGDDGRSIAPVYAEAIDRKIVRARGAWSKFLTESEAAILITRRINVADEFDCISDFYLDAERFKMIMKMPIEKLHRTIIRNFIAKEFNAPTLSISQNIASGPFSERIRQLLSGGPESKVGMRLELRSRTHGDVPISFQQIFIPSNASPLEMPNARVL